MQWSPLVLSRASAPSLEVSFLYERKHSFLFRAAFSSLFFASQNCRVPRSCLDCFPFFEDIEAQGSCLARPPLLSFNTHRLNGRGHPRFSALPLQRDNAWLLTFPFLVLFFHLLSRFPVQSPGTGTFSCRSAALCYRRLVSADFRIAKYSLLGLPSCYPTHLSPPLRKTWSSRILPLFRNTKSPFHAA